MKKALQMHFALASNYFSCFYDHFITGESRPMPLTICPWGMHMIYS